jgi:hypothetical protein
MHHPLDTSQELRCILLLLQALLQHNHVIKQAADDNIGYVLEQEGDSFTLAFHDPLDAAAFTLQVCCHTCIKTYAFKHTCIYNMNFKTHEVWDTPALEHELWNMKFGTHLRWSMNFA